MKSASTYLAVLVFMIMTHSLHSREFKSIEGKIINADLITVRGEEVVLKMDKKEFRLPLSRFSKEDQDFMVEWRTRMEGERRILEGAWTITELGVAGTGAVVPASERQKSTQIVFAGEEVTQTSKKAAEEIFIGLVKGTYTIDFEKNPKEMTVLITEGKDKGETRLWKYECDRLSLILIAGDFIETRFSRSIP